MRFLFLLIFLAGAAAGIGMPFAGDRLFGGAIGSWPAYAPTSGFRAIKLVLKPEDAPLGVALDLSAPAPFVPDEALSSASVTVAHGGKTVLASAVAFRGAAMRDENPQTPERTFRADAGMIQTVEAGEYTFTVSRGEAEIPQVTRLDLVLARGAPGWARLVQPAGFSLMAVGFIGFMLTAFRRSPPEAGAPSEPARPRWGRDAAP